jgi:hypothetical protein
MGMKKHWRRSSSKTRINPESSIVSTYSGTIEKIIDIATGTTVGPRHLFTIFNRSIKLILGSSITKEQLNRYSTVIQELSREDLKQQCYLYLIELWNFFKVKWSNRSNKYPTVFYDVIRSTLPRWIGRYVGKLILAAEAEQRVDKVDGITEPIQAQIDIDLSWIMLNDKESMFNFLSISDRYKLYLRYWKRFKVSEVSELLNRNIDLVSKDYVRIKENLKCRYLE